MAIASNFPAIKPSLSLDFANTKRLDSRVTFTRTTTATYYDGATTAKAEENLLTYSQEFDNAAWNKEFATITANTLAAPDGTTTADTLAENTTNNLHRTQPAFISFTSGQTYTFSVYAKNGDRNFVQLFFPSAFSTSDYANFDISTGVLGTVGGAATASIVNVGSGWYRCIVTVTATSTASGAPSIGLITSATSIRAENYLGASKFIYIWGAQLEQRSSVTAYTATTTQAITNYIPVLLTAASGVARFQHNPTTDESLGLLIEEARTNLLLQSADFSNAAWSKTRSSITSNTIVAPDGTLTGDKIIATTDNDSHIISQTLSSTTNTNPYTLSFYLKSGEYSSAFVRLVEGSPFTRVTSVLFDASAGTFSSLTDAGGAGSSSASITSVGNGWYRCSLTTTLGGSSTNIINQNFIYNGSTTFAGNGYSGIYIWGAQIEAGAFATSYIATTAATVTRNADAASMTGSNFTSWYNAGQGTLYTESQTFSISTNSFAAQISDNSYNNRVIIGQDSTIMVGQVVVSGVVTLDPTSKPSRSNNLIKQAFGFAVNDSQFAANNVQSTADLLGAMAFGLTRIDIGSDHGGSNKLNGTIKKLTYYPLRVTDANLQALTS